MRFKAPAVAALAAAAAIALATVLSLPDPRQAPSRPLASSTSSTVAPRAAPAHPAPPGIAEDAWRELLASLEQHPQREAEIQRITSYLVFSDRVSRFRELSQRGGPTSELKGLARQLLSEIDARLAARELHAGEALQLRTAMLQVTETDPAAREAALAQWRAQADARTPPTVSRQDQAFQARQNQLLAAWQARAPQDRDPRQLESELEALRQEFYTPPLEGALPGGRK